jgi:hypothetical protein
MVKVQALETAFLLHHHIQKAEGKCTGNFQNMLIAIVVL